MSAAVCALCLCSAPPQALDVLDLGPDGEAIPVCLGCRDDLETVCTEREDALWEALDADPEPAPLPWERGWDPDLHALSVAALVCEDRPMVHLDVA